MNDGAVFQPEPQGPLKPAVAVPLSDLAGGEGTSHMCPPQVSGPLRLPTAGGPGRTAVLTIQSADLVTSVSPLLFLRGRTTGSILGSSPTHRPARTADPPARGHRTGHSPAEGPITTCPHSLTAISAHRDSVPAAVTLTCPQAGPKATGQGTNIRCISDHSCMLSHIV